MARDAVPDLRHKSDIRGDGAYIRFIMSNLRRVHQLMNERRRVQLDDGVRALALDDAVKLRRRDDGPVAVWAGDGWPAVAGPGTSGERAV